jgi:hypothetical protein
MINNKKGLSTVVTTLIIILLVLVAIGIIWVVIRGIVEGGSAGVDFATKCLNVDVRAVSPSVCTATDCDIYLERKAGGDSIAGVKMVFTNTTLGVSNVVPREGDIAPLATNLTSNIDPNLASNEIPNKVAITAYFEDDAGVEYLCSQNPSYEF